MKHFLDKKENSLDFCSTEQKSTLRCFLCHRFQTKTSLGEQKGHLRKILRSAVRSITGFFTLSECKEMPENCH